MASQSASKATGTSSESKSESKSEDTQVSSDVAAAVAAAEAAVASVEESGSTPEVGPTDVSAPGSFKTGTKLIQYIGVRKDFRGMQGSHREITKTQFKEAGVEEPFTNPAMTSVLWTPENGHQVAAGSFTPAALAILAAQDDLVEVEAE